MTTYTKNGQSHDKKVSGFSLLMFETEIGRKRMTYERSLETVGNRR